MKKNLIIPFFIILIVFSLAACGPSQGEETYVLAETEPTDQLSADQEIGSLSVLDQLAELKMEFNLNSLSEINGPTQYCDAAGLCTFEAAEQGFLAENLYTLSNGQGLFFNLTFNEPLQQGQSLLQFIFLDSATGLVLEQNGVTVSIDNLPFAQYPFPDPVVWEIGKVYSLFFLMDEDGFFSVNIWEEGEPESLFYTSTRAEGEVSGFPETPSEFEYQLSLWVSQNQKINISNIWALGSGNSCMQTSPSETSEEQPAADLTPESPVFNNLEEYNILSAEPVEQLSCDSINASSAGTFRWEGMNDSNCELFLENGNALVFDFTLENEMALEQGHVIWMLNALDEENISYGIGVAGAEETVKVLGSQIEMQNFDFDTGISWEIGKKYSAVLLLEPDGGKLFRLWETEYPQNRITSHITAEDWQTAVPGSDNLIWNFGVWMMPGQAVRVENMHRLQVEPSSEDESEAAAAATQSELDTTSLANLSGYQVRDVQNISNLVCENDLEELEGSWQFSGGAEGLMGNCDLEIQNGQAIMLDFSIREEFSSESGRATLGLMTNSGSIQEDSKPIQIEFCPTSNDFSIKQNYQLINGDQIQGNISWEPDEDYRLVLLAEEDGTLQAVIWPLDRNETLAYFRIETQDLQNITNDFDLQKTSWLFNYFVESGQGFTLKNMRKFEIEGSYLLPESLSSQSLNEQDLSDQIVDLSEYYITPLEAITTISCEDGLLTGDVYQISSVDEHLRGKCKLTFKTGQALAFNFSYDSELGEDGNRIFLEFNDQNADSGRRTSVDLLHEILQVKKKEAGAGEFLFSKNPSLTPGETYTIFVFAGEYGYKYFLVFPAEKSLKEVLENPGDAAYAAISQTDWYKMFGGVDREQNLELVYDISGNLSLSISNPQIFELH